LESLLLEREGIRKQRNYIKILYTEKKKKKRMAGRPPEEEEEG